MAVTEPHSPHDGMLVCPVDVANQVRAHGRQVRVAVGLDYLVACPVRGFHRLRGSLT
jgi:hypothetical protein